MFKNNNRCPQRLQVAVLKKVLMVFVVIMMCSCQSNQMIELPVANGLVAYYSFDGHVDDSSENQNHGAQYGGVTFVPGKSGKAAKFDGVDDYILIIPRSDVSAIGDFTAGAWTYVEGWKYQSSPYEGKDRQYIFDGHTHSNTTARDFYRPGFALIYDWTSEAAEIHNFIYYGRDWLEQNIKADVNGQWRFFVFVRKDENTYTYLDGQLLTTSYAAEVKRRDVLDMRHNWYIGAFNGNNPHYNDGVFNYSFHGLIDDFFIYDRALSAVEIQTLYEW